MSDTPGPEDLKQTALVQAIRKAIHDISTPVGVVRMALYFLETQKPDDAKRAEYHNIMNQNIDKIETHLRHLRAVMEQTMQGGNAGGEGTKL